VGKDEVTPTNEKKREYQKKAYPSPYNIKNILWLPDSGKLAPGKGGDTSTPKNEYGLPVTFA